MTTFDHVKDSGNRQEFSTGSVRDTQEGKPRLDLIPQLLLRRLGLHFANGAKKYGDDNWKLGQPLRRYYGSAFNHLLAVGEGKEDEDHLSAAIWNLQAIMWTLEEIRAGRLPITLANLPYRLGPTSEIETTPGTRPELVQALFDAAKAFDKPLPTGAVVITPEGRFKMNAMGMLDPYEVSEDAVPRNCHLEPIDKKPEPMLKCAFCNTNSEGGLAHARWCKFAGKEANQLGA